MMKGLYRFSCLLLSVLMLLLFAFSAAAESADVPAVADMAKVNVSWDLKPDQPVTGYTRFIGLEPYYPIEVTVTNMQKSVTKKGDICLTFTITFTDDFVPNEEEIEFLAHHKDGKNCGGFFAWAVLDYETGLDLENKNKLGVTVKYKEAESIRPEYKAADKVSIKFSAKWVCNLTVTMPNDYDGLCIGALGFNYPLGYDAENKFWKGKSPFSKTIYHSPTKQDLSHFMRVDAAFLATVPDAE